MATVPFGGTFYKSASLPISAQEIVNLYSNEPQATTPTKQTIFTPAGLKSETTAGVDVNNRGGHVFQDQPYVVNGNTLYRIDQAIDGFGNVTFSSVDVSGGVSIPGTQRVMMEDNGAEGDQLCIVVVEGTNQFNAYIYTKTTNVLVQISDIDFDGPVSSVRYVDGYFMFTKKASQKWFTSNLRDGLSYLATDFILAEADPDNIVGSWVLNNEPLIFGTQSFEPFQNVSQEGFPFQRVEGGVQDKGLRAPFGITEFNDVLIFVGGNVNEDPAIWVTDGGTPQKISTTAIDTELSSYSSAIIESSFAWNYSQAGAQFVGFTFLGRRTFIYDFTSGLWHSRESVDTQGTIIPYRVSSIMDAYGVLLVGDVISENIGTLDLDTYTEYGEFLRRRFVTPQIDNEGEPFYVNALELWGEVGVGLSNGQGSDPKILMSFSTDGAKTYSNPISRSWGKIGQYMLRVIWNSLGRVSREICFKFEMSDPVKWSFGKLEARFD